MPADRRRPADSEFRMPSLRLDGRRAVVVGGSRGLGLGIALALAHSGADIVLCARSEDRLRQAAALVKDTGVSVETAVLDVTDVTAIRGCFSSLTESDPRFDILVNSAGVNLRRRPEEFSEQDWEYIMDTNLKGSFFACQEAFRFMAGQGRGKIINVGSLAFEVIVPNIALYAISKGGMRQMTRALAVDWAGAGVNVNALAPGRFWTEMTDAVFSDPDAYDSAVGVIPLGRPGVSADLAGAAVLLASEASDYITGQTIVVDGGWLVSGGVRA